MAEAATTEAPETIVETAMDNPSTQDMELEAPDAGAEDPPADIAANGDASSKRARDESDDSENDAKKQKVEKSLEEERLEKFEGKQSVQVSLGPKTFGSSVEMFDYFFKFLHYWTPNINVNKYEHVVLLELLKKGHAEPEKKIGDGVDAFQIRYHPQWKSRCFFIIRNDGSVDDFSFRKCVDHILPLPENMQIKSNVNKALGRRDSGHGGKGGGGGRGGGRGRGRGRGRGGKPRN